MSSDNMDDELPNHTDLAGQTHMEHNDTNNTVQTPLMCDPPSIHEEDAIATHDADCHDTDDETVTCSTIKHIPNALAGLLRRLMRSINRRHRKSKVKDKCRNIDKDDDLIDLQNVNLGTSDICIIIPTDTSFSGDICHLVKAELASSNDTSNRAKSDAKVTNIYRRPVSRHGNPHRSNSYSRYPNDKRNSLKLRRTASNVSGGRHSADHEERHDTNNAKGTLKNGSHYNNRFSFRIGNRFTYKKTCSRWVTENENTSTEDSFRHRSNSLPELPPSILKNMANGSVKRSTSQRERCKSTRRHKDVYTRPKRASFKERVDVYYYTAKDAACTSDEVLDNDAEYDINNSNKDNDDCSSNKSNHAEYRESDSIMSEYAMKRNTNPDDPATEIRNPAEIEHVINSELHQITFNGNISKPKGPDLCDDRTNNDLISELVTCIDSESTSNTDPEGNTCRRLHMTFSVDDSCMNDKTSVKALSGGRAVIIQLYPRDEKNHLHLLQPGDLEQNPTWRSLDAKIQLPSKVDPYSVKARVHGDGILTISANVVYVI